MNKMKKTLCFLFLLLGGWISMWAQAPSGKLTAADYVDLYNKLAVKEMKRSGVPASITLAQGMLESSNGNSRLAVNGNNHFGIKCHKGWEGGTLYQDDDHPNECFRKYKSVFDSYADHSNFLRSRERYTFLFSIKTTDYKEWAHGLKRAGYATDPQYAQLLIKIIEDHRLYRFDQDINPDDVRTYEDIPANKKGMVDNFVIDMYRSHTVKYNNGVGYVEVKNGDTFKSISQEFDMRDWEIFAYNDLNQNAELGENWFLYVEAKRNKANVNHQIHVVKPGETLHYISQKYGVKLSRLIKYNDFSKTEVLKEGMLVKLRSKR
jgi:LysM repeat protein